MARTHRVAWSLTYGAPPAGMLRSGCDNLLCVRHDHQALTDRKVGAVNLVRTPRVRFEAMVHKGPGCWDWLGSTVNGYGQFLVIDPAVGRPMLGAHRFAWEAAFGAIPAGNRVHHTGGSRACVRPDHLVLGRASVGRSPSASGRPPGPPLAIEDPTVSSARQSDGAHRALAKHQNDREGQGFVEYGLILALMALVAILALALFGAQISNLVNTFAQ
jgi:Flp pilus assembly pilin Flp